LSKRGRGVEYFIKALSTGERTAAQRLEGCLAPDVDYDTNTQPGAVPIGREVFSGEIRRVRLDGGYGSRAPVPAAPTGAVEEIPLAVRGLINNALANQTPVVVTYVDEDGAPHSSLRGSVCVLNPTQFAIWVRHADGGLPTSIVKQPGIALFYSDRRANATVNVLGRAHIAEDPETRRKVFELAPEVEQTHDPLRHGVAVVIDVTRLQANAGAAATTP
jgi:hypothetical protein